MAEAALLVRTFRVEPYSVTVTVPRPIAGRATTLVCEWFPQPSQPLSREQLAAYRRGRDAVIAELAQHVGGGVALVLES